MRENQAMGYFLSGLHARIHRLIGIQEPKTVMRAMAPAHNIEESIWVSPVTHIPHIQPKAKKQTRRRAKVGVGSVENKGARH